MVWVRPDNVPFPNVWRTFTGKVKINGKANKYIIKDITDDLIEPCIDHMVTYFLVREVLTSHDGFVEDETSLREIKDLWRRQLRYRVGLVAIVEGEGDESKRIAGLNMTTIAERDSQPEQFTGKGMQRFYKVVTDMFEKENLFEKYGVDYYLSALGLSVSAHHRGDNVGYHLLAARDLLCPACGITVAVTVFSNPAAVTEAKKAGYHMIQDTTTDTFFDNGEPLYPRLKNTAFTLTAKIIPKM